MFLKFDTNQKLKDSDGNYLFAHFSLPAIKTCPNAGKCKTGCYATQGNYRFPSVQSSYQKNWDLTRDTKLFTATLSGELEKLDLKAKKAGKYLAVRIHTSGDFYSRDYYNAWVDLSFRFPNIKFYAYTKMISQAKGRLLPFNFTLIFSEGGLQDGLIGASDRHSRVFSSLEALLAAGYDNASEDDSVAFLSRSGRIGLIYHGAAKREWSTDRNDGEIKLALRLAE
jgi:hypothetical protein